MVIAGVASLILGLAGRHFAWSHTVPVVLFGAPLFLLLSLAVIFAFRRAEFMDAAEGMVRLDLILGLNNALTAALAGHGPWPDLPAGSDDLLRFDWRRVLTPIVICIGLVAAGMLIPLPADSSAGAKIPPPRSHEEIAAAIAELEKLGTARKEDLEQIRRQLEEITGQPPEDWYSHSSLEAADHLKAGLQEQLLGLARNLSHARASLGALDTGAQTMSAAEQERLAREYKAALQRLKSASPGLNEKLMSALSKVDPSNLKSLGKHELENMLTEMRSAEGACKNCSGRNGGGKQGGGDAQNELNDLLGDGGKPKYGNGGRNSEAGRGGIQRGPGVAPLPLSNSPTGLSTRNPEALSASDLSRARPGDLIGTADTEHQLDKSPVGTQSTGAISSSGDGGGAVWRDSLMPQEKAVLQRYFR